MNRLCREAVAEDQGRAWTIRVAGADEEAGRADVCVWEFHAGFDFPESLEKLAPRHLLVIDRRDIPRLESRLERPGVDFVLKPLSRERLALFLNSGDGAPQSAESRRLRTALKLQEQEQERVSFLARASHDLRVPLTAINGYCGLLLMENIGPLNSEQQRILGRMQHSSRRLLRMVSAMMELSADGQSPQAPQMEPGDLERCIGQAVHEVALMLEERELQISVALQPPAKLLCFDACQMEQVFVNLLENAAKFSPRAGNIHICGEPFFKERRRSRRVGLARERRVADQLTPNGYRVDVANAGPFLSEDELSRLFEERVTNSRHRASGYGLGLAICKRLVEGHGGAVWAGNGATGPVFSMFLPHGQADLAH